MRGVTGPRPAGPHRPGRASTPSTSWPTPPPSEVLGRAPVAVLSEESGWSGRSGRGADRRPRPGRRVDQRLAPDSLLGHLALRPRRRRPARGPRGEPGHRGGDHRRAGRGRPARRGADRPGQGRAGRGRRGDAVRPSGRVAALEAVPGAGVGGARACATWPPARVDGLVDGGAWHAPWDYMGGLLICREAGAEVVDAAGRELVVADPDARRQLLAAGHPGPAGGAARPPCPTPASRREPSPSVRRRTGCAGALGRRTWCRLGGRRRRRRPGSVRAGWWPGALRRRHSAS